MKGVPSCGEREAIAARNQGFMGTTGGRKHFESWN